MSKPWSPTNWIVRPLRQASWSKKDSEKFYSNMHVSAKFSKVQGPITRTEAKTPRQMHEEIFLMVST